MIRDLIPSMQYVDEEVVLRKQSGSSVREDPVIFFRHQSTPDWHYADALFCLCHSCRNKLGSEHFPK